MSFKRIRLKKKFKRKALIGGLTILLAIIAYFPLKKAIHRYFNPRDIGTLKVHTYRDLNAVHLKFAQKNGIAGFKSDTEFKKNLSKLLREKKLVHVKSSKYYRIKTLTHSHPYLTPEASQLLKEIGQRFGKKLEQKGLRKYKYQISSMLRTGESQKQLSKSNVNASSNSSHLYGTTFDISYRKLVKKRFPGISVEITDGPAILLLSEAIGELRKEGKCLVVTERIEACFHITVR